MAKVSNTSQGGTLFLEGRFLPHQPSILVAVAVVNPIKSQEIPIKLMNWAPDPTMIYQGTRIGTLEEMKSDIIVSEVTPLREPTEISREKQELLNEVVASTLSSLTPHGEVNCVALRRCFYSE